MNASGDDAPLLGLYLLEGDDMHDDDVVEPLTRAEHFGAVLGAGLGRAAVAVEYTIGVWLVLYFFGKPW